MVTPSRVAFGTSASAFAWPRVTAFQPSSPLKLRHSWPGGIFQEHQRRRNRFCLEQVFPISRVPRVASVQDRCAAYHPRKKQAFDSTDCLQSSTSCLRSSSISGAAALARVVQASASQSFRLVSARYAMLIGRERHFVRRKIMLNVIRAGCLASALFLTAPSLSAAPLGGAPSGLNRASALDSSLVQQVHRRHYRRHRHYRHYRRHRYLGFYAAPIYGFAWRGHHHHHFHHHHH